MIELNFDMTKPQGRVQTIHGRQGETGLSFLAHIYDDGIAADFSERYLELCIIRPDKRWVAARGCCEQRGNSNTFEVTLPEEALVYPGISKVCYFAVRTNSDKLVATTDGFLLDIDPSATYEAKLEPYSDQVHDLIAELELLRGSFDQTLQELKEQGQAQLDAIEKEIDNLAHNELAGYVDTFVQSALERILGTQIPELVLHEVNATVRPMLDSYIFSTERLSGVLPPDKGGTGATTRRGVKEWLGIALTKYKVTFEGEGFTVSTTGGPLEDKTAQVDEESTFAFTIAADDAHYLKSVKVGDEPLEEPYSIQVMYAPVTVTVETGAQYDVTFSGENCKVTEYPEKTAKMKDTDTLKFNVVADESYHISSVTAEGATLTGETNPYTLSEPTGAVTVTIVSEADEAA